jgi:hypothetical protein
MMARADVMKIVEDSHSRKCPAMEIGINSSRLERIVFVFSIEISERFPTPNHSLWIYGKNGLGQGIWW